MPIHTFIILAYKESAYLEDCIKSVLDQSAESEVVIATSTPNDFINETARKYNLRVIVNERGSLGIGYDFDFAISCGKTSLVTIAHQDDVYDRTYAEEIINAYGKYENALIIFPDYYELRDGVKTYSNKNLKIKKALLFPLRFKCWSGRKFIKRSALRFGDAICCPAVTFNTNKVSVPVFESDLKCDIDWLAWERLSREKGRFIYIHKPLMGHRIHSASTTTDIINDNARTSEDYIVLRKFWPKPIAKIIQKLYSSSENSNNLDKSNKKRD